MQKTDDRLPEYHVEGNDHVWLYPKAEQVTEAVDFVADAGGDYALLPRRVGAAPYFLPTPYTNNTGVRVRMWTCISMVMKRMPDRTLLVYPRIIEVDRKADWQWRMLTREAVWALARHSRVLRAVPYEDSPFDGRLFQWNGGED